MVVSMTESKDAKLSTVFIGKGIADEGRIADPRVAHKAYDTLTQYPQIQHILVRHEQAAAHAGSEDTG